MQTEFINQITPVTSCYGTIEGKTNNPGQIALTLYKTRYEDSKNVSYQLEEPKLIKTWYFGDHETKPTDHEIKHEILLNDWSRWNTELPEGQKIEISESIYYDLLTCLPPEYWKGSYFEVGESHHHERGKAIHRACWIENGQYFTGYPKR